MNMNTRRLPTRAAAKEKATNANTTEEKGGATMDGDSKLHGNDSSPPAKRQRCVNENDVDITDDATQQDVKKPSATLDGAQTPKQAGINPLEKEGSDANNKEPALLKVLKNDDDQTATTCTETPATEEKNGATMKEPVSRADFHPVNPAGDGKPPDSFKKAMPPIENAAFSYPSFPAPPLPFYGPPGNVPPTVHMPFPVSHISPLQIQQPQKSGKNGVKEPKRIDSPPSNPVTPRHASVKESEAALAMLGCATDGSATKNAKPSSSSPTADSKKAALDATLPPLQAGVTAPPFKYPPPPEQMDVNNFHCFPQVPQSDLKFNQAEDEYPLPPISATFGPDDDFNPDTPSSRHSSIGDVLNAANMVERTESTIKTTRKRYAGEISAQSPRRRKSSKTQGGANLFSAPCFPSGLASITNPPSIIGSAIKSAHSIAPEVADAAEKACILAQQALENPYIGKQLLLSMAIVRTNPRSPPSSYPAHGTLLTDRFHWAQFPPLDTILRKSMKRYYELSTQKCQSKDQQDFNNSLVDQVKNEATKYGWEFDRKAFDDKKIRDRIRCFFKTHIQNAKKRLKTMLRNPSKKANIKALAEHFHLIEEKNKVEPPLKKEEGDESEEDERGEVNAPGSNGVSAVYFPESSDKAQVAAYSEV
mmetsp:Transcript_4726/g.7348  ORF Transcript_4726/g.7348 Transcript_4726/m.7348 type:complete len:648 (+) Transcript_4726:370-2313(+)